jgi:hypothetical protein
MVEHFARRQPWLVRHRSRSGRSDVLFGKAMSDKAKVSAALVADFDVLSRFRDDSGLFFVDDNVRHIELRLAIEIA